MQLAAPEPVSPSSLVLAEEDWTCWTENKSVGKLISRMQKLPTLPGTSADGELPAGTPPLNVSVCPVSSVTVTVQLSAEAVGKAAIAMTTSTKLVVPRAILSLRLLDTLAYLLPPCAMQS